MTFPAGVTTCSVTAGAALTLFGDDARIDVTVAPILGGNLRRVVWAATGQPLAAFTGTYVGQNGMPATFAVPHVDQNGFVDGSGNAFKNWSYLATVKISSGDLTQTTLYTQAFQVVVGQTSIDLDLVPDGTVGAPSSSPVPAVTSVGGQTGAVTATQIMTAINTQLRALIAPGIANAGRLTGYGASSLGYPGTASAMYFTRLFERLGSKLHNNLGINGARMCDVSAFAFGTVTATRQGTADDEAASTTGSGTWTTGIRTPGVTILDGVGNDAHFDGVTATGGTTAKSRAGYTNALDAMIRLLRAQSITEDNDASITYTAGWADLTGATTASGNRLKYTVTANDTATVVRKNGDAIVLHAVDASGSGLVGAAYSITCDGAAWKTGTTNDQFRKAGGPINPNTTQMAIPIEGLAAGNHTFVIKHTGSNGQYLFLDCLLRESPTPQTVIIPKVLPLPAAGYAEIIALGGLGSSASLDAVYNAIIDTVVARFPADGSVQSVDPGAAGYDPATMIGTADGYHIHPNDLGNLFLANLLFGVINALPARDGLVLLS